MLGATPVSWYSLICRAYIGWPGGKSSGSGGGPASQHDTTGRKSIQKPCSCFLLVASLTAFQAQPIIQVQLRPPTAWPHGLSRHHTHQLGLPSPQAKAPRFVSRHPWHMPSPRSSNAKNSMSKCELQKQRNFKSCFFFFFVLCYSFTNP